MTKANFRPLSAAALFGIFIYPDVEPIDLGGTAGVISMATRVVPNAAFTTIALQAGQVRLAGGLTVIAEHGIETAPPCDAVIVCGGPGWPQAAAEEPLLAFLRGIAPAGLASVCTGAMILAAAGVLDGRTATTRRRAVGRETEAPLNRLSRDHPVTAVAAAVVDDGVVTGGGVSLAIDATLHLLGRIYGDETANRIAEIIEYDRAFAANRAALGWISEIRETGL